MTKASTPTEKSKKQRDKKPANTSISQRLRTDLGWPVGVTAVTPLVWLNRCPTAQPSH